MGKYHIKPDGEYGACTAKYICPYSTARKDASNPSPHFESAEEAEVFSLNLFKTEDRAKKLQGELEAFGEHPTITQVQELGRKLDEVFYDSLSFNPDELEERMTEDQEQEYTRMVSTVLRGLSSGYNGGELEVSGSRAKDVLAVSQLLPHGVNGLVARIPLNAVNKRGKSDYGGAFDGKYKYGFVKRVREPKVEKGTWIRGFRDAEVGEFIFDEYDVKDPRMMSMSLHKKVGENEAEEYWIGHKYTQKGVSFRKVDGIELRGSNGEVLEIDKPIYQVFKAKEDLGAEIVLNRGAESSTILHELTHHYELSVRYGADTEEKQSLINRMFNEIKEEKRSDLGYGGEYENAEYYTGFPSKYMGLANRGELFTVATEGLFYPNRHMDNGRFYGKDRHKNADKIRQWTFGMWAILAKKGNERVGGSTDAPTI